jgi:hypothetical protein
MDKINKMGPRPFYYILIVSIVLPFLIPFTLPMSISPWTRDAYNLAESLPEGSIILAPNIIEASCWGECGYGWIATWQHYFEKGFRIVALSLYKDGPLLCERIIDILKARGVKIEYGVNYVNLGFVAGINSAIAAMVEPPDGMDKVFKTDYFGNAVETLPLMKEVHSVLDVAIISHVSSGWGEDWIGLAVIPYGSKYIYNIIGAGTPWLINEYDLKLALGGLGGLKGGAEYELLLNNPSAAVLSMNAISTTHIVIVVIIVLANIAMFLTTKKGGAS